MSPLRSVVYVSSATVEMSTAELEALLLGAKAQNRVNGITGVLLYNSGNFMQCFEGPADRIPATYERIRASRRHRDILELMNENVEQRSFQGWEMALIQPTQSELLAISSARWHAIAGAPASDAPGGDGFELLQSFWRSARR